MGFRGGGSTTIENFGPPAGDIAVGNAEAEGASPNATRADHVHAFPAAGAGTGASSSTPGDAEADGVATTAARTDHVHHRTDSYATTVVGPDAFGAAAHVGTSAALARADHDHGLPAAPAVPAAATTVVGPDAFGAAAVVGTSTSFARADHDHGLPSAPAVPSPATTVVGPDGFGSPAVVGTSSLYSRADHDHGLPSAPGAGAMAAISSQVLASAAASITFSSIPGTYHHLQVIAVGRSAAPSTEFDGWAVQVNGDTGAHYDLMGVSTDGSSPAGARSGGGTSWQNWGTSAASPDMPASSATAGIASQLNIEIPVYAGTTFQKVASWQSGFADLVTAASDYVTGNANTAVWRSTAAITSIKIFTTSGSNLVTGTAAYLYGIT